MTRSATGRAGGRGREKDDIGPGDQEMAELAFLDESRDGKCEADDEFMVPHEGDITKSSPSRASCDSRVARDVS